jgi:Phage integrase, N-terminal SAM-like domain
MSLVAGPDVRTLLGSWELHLRAEHKGPATIKSYGAGVRRFLAWCADTGHSPTLDRPTVAAFVADILDTGAEPATARSRHLALRRFSAWLVEERELLDDPLLGSKPPKLDAKVVPVLTDEQLRTRTAGRWRGAAPRPRDATSESPRPSPLGAGEQRQPAQHANEHQVDESEGHSERACWAGSGTVTARSACHETR